jgi:ribosomal protein L16 Arg81 hydroxylase
MTGIVTNIHYDANPGFVVQLRGRKRILIWPPSEKENLYITYPMNHPYYRRSRYDGRIEDVGVDFPKIKQAKYIEVILKPDECLYIPKGWFHYVETLDDITVSSIVRLYPS